MRFIMLLLILLGSVLAGESSQNTAYPLWDGHESVAEYARKVNLPPTKTLDLGNGVKMELILIPAGTFIMGTPKPVPVDEEGFQKKLNGGKSIFIASSGILLLMLTLIIVQAVRIHHRPKYSLLWLLAATVVAGISVTSGLLWQQSRRELERAKAEYPAARLRFDNANPEEKPAHQVILTKPFYLGKYPVTQEQYQQLIGRNPSAFIGKYNPVEKVSWYDARYFCDKLSEKTNQIVRLPSEAEWEYSCRAGTTTTYYSGDAVADLAKVGWYTDNANSTTHPVGEKEANAFGLYDMHGNVMQWCQDWWHEKYYNSAPIENPLGPKSYAHDGEDCSSPAKELRVDSWVFLHALNGKRVLRGGCWESEASDCRSAYRFKGGHITLGAEIIGFRVAVDAEETTP